MEESGYNCYALCTESANYLNGSEYITQGANYTGTSTIQLGHSFMNHLAQADYEYEDVPQSNLGAIQDEAPILFDYMRDEAGNLLATAVVFVRPDYFDGMKVDIDKLVKSTEAKQTSITESESDNYFAEDEDASEPTPETGVGPAVEAPVITSQPEDAEGAFGEGDHDLEFKDNKYVTYNFTVMEDVDTNNTAAKEDNESVVPKDEEDSESVVPKDEEDSDVVNTPEAEPAVFDLRIDLENAEIISWLYINEAGDIIEAGAEEKPVIKEGYITAVYVKTDSKNVPNAIWTSAEDVDADALADAFDASNAEHIYGAGQFNLKKNKNHYSVLTFESDALVTKVIDIDA